MILFNYLPRIQTATTTTTTNNVDDLDMNIDIEIKPSALNDLCHQQKMPCYEKNDCTILCNNNINNIVEKFQPYDCKYNMCTVASQISEVDSATTTTAALQYPPGMSQKHLRHVSVSYKDQLFFKQAVSLNSDFWLDDGVTLSNGVCSHGVLTFVNNNNNNNNNTPNITDCVCAPDSYLGYFKNYKPHVPRCIEKNVAHLIDEFVLVGV